MLHLTRKENTAILIGPAGPNQIRIVVDHITRGSARLSIEAPREIVILREELLDQPKKEERK